MPTKGILVLTPEGFQFFVFMPPTSDLASLPLRFFSPALDLLPGCLHQRLCPELSDSDWVRLGVQRCLAPQSSGRGFLQTLASLAPSLCPDNSHFFESLKSQRRLDLCAELNAKLCVHARRVLPDALAAFPCLAGFDIHAGDGHYHAHAVHDPADSKGNKHPVGHLYARNLRYGTLSHLTVNDQVTRKKEHDMRGLKRQTIDTLRQGAKKGRKVLYVWDRAGIDFNQWHDWKQGSGIYMLSRCKANMALVKCGDLPFERGDAINAGIQSDELVGSGTAGVLLRRVIFIDVLTGITYEYLTNLLQSSVPPGVIAHLYKMRWDIEKSFDEVKNKLGEKKAWASSATAKSMQAQFICLSVNLLQLIEDEIGKEGIVNQPEVKRRAARLEAAQEQAASQNAVLPKTLVMMQQMTQHSVKLIRWVAAQLWLNVPWKAACEVLIALYAKL
jgi:hypothetical protein